MFKSQEHFGILIVLMVFLVCCAKKKDRVAVSADGVPIHFDVLGAGDPALVFIHGWSRSRMDWVEQMTAFSKNHRVVSIDLAGHGESGGERDDWSIPAFSQDVIAVIQKLNLQKVFLIGHSLGAPVAVEAARRLPDRIVGIVPVDAFQDVEETFTQDQIDGILAPFKHDFVGTYAQGARMMLKDSTQIQKSIEQIASFSPEIGIASLERCYQYYSNDLIPALQEVKVPIRCINSDAIPTNTEAARRYASDFDVVVMEGVGHEMQNGHPDQFNRLLEGVLVECER